MKLDIGAGPPGFQKEPLDEWVHLDIIPFQHIELVADFGSIPLEDATMEEIWLGDVIEHVPVWRHAEVLVEWNRVLVLGGRIGGETPSPESAMKRYAVGDMNLDALISALYGKRHTVTEQHFLTYTPTRLTALFAQYGFDVAEYSGSPGPVHLPWWLLFRGRKARSL